MIQRMHKFRSFCFGRIRCFGWSRRSDGRKHMRTFLMKGLISFNCKGGETIRLANGQKTYCVAKPSASEEELSENKDFATKHVNCSLIDPGFGCYYPNTLMNHASVCMNLYYQAMGRNLWNCDFKNSALIVVTDPSYGDCQYQYT